jgi:hypothetical protein
LPDKKQYIMEEREGRYINPYTDSRVKKAVGALA